jgi:hypothetical protein
LEYLVLPAGPLLNFDVRPRDGIVTATDHGRFEYLAQGVAERLPHGPRLAVLGSTDFWHADSKCTCTEAGRLLAGLPGLVLLTGGVEGIGEAVGRSFFQTRRAAGEEPLVYHVLPEGEAPWDYGETLFAGSDMTERREVLGRLARLYLLVEGGPRAGHEVDVASALGAVILPVGRSGGYAATLYDRLSRPAVIDAATWAVLGSSASTPEETARAVLQAVRACVGMSA